MGSIVAAVGVSHAPGITAWPESADANQLSAIREVFGRLRQLVEQAEPDVIVYVTPEHWVNFSLANMPSFCIGVSKS